MPEGWSSSLRFRFPFASYKLAAVFICVKVQRSLLLVCETISFSFFFFLSLSLALRTRCTKLLSLRVIVRTLTTSISRTIVAFFLLSGSFLFLDGEQEIITEAWHYVSDTVNVKIEG